MAASWFDAKTYGYRQKIIIGLALGLVIAQLLTAATSSAVVETILGVLLLLVLTSYAIARVQDFRDERGRFTLKLAFGNLWALFKFVFRRDRAQSDGDPAPARRFAQLCLWIGGAALALRSLLVIIGGSWRWFNGAGTPDLDLFLSLLLLGWLPFGYGAYAFTADLWRRFFGRVDVERDVPDGPAANREILTTDLQRLPPALDLVGPNASGAAAVHAIQDPVLKKIVTALPQWRPRKSRYEAEYQAALGRFLRRHLRGHSIQEQFPLQDRDRDARVRRRRIDFVVDNAIAIELKPRIERADASQRAIGQVREYAEMWGKRGPVLLLIVETPPGFDSSFAVRDLAIRDGSAAATMVVAAGHRVNA
ncbi:MAG: GxxExxY protein [Nannocystaceae bacterium]